MATEAASFLLRCVTGTDTDFRLMEGNSGLPGHVGDASQRGAQVSFYVDGQGKAVGPNSKAGDYLGTAVFNYDYEPGSGENVVQPPSAPVAAAQPPALKGALKDNAASVTVSRATVQAHLDGKASSPAVAGLISWSCTS